jgi:hypothetical protein
VGMVAGLCLLVVPGLLVLLGEESAEPFLDAAGVVPAVDVAQERGVGLGAGGELGCRPSTAVRS